MFPTVITYMRSSYTESPTGSAHPEPRSKFYFVVEKDHVYVTTMNDGSQISFRHSSYLLPVQVFDIEFCDLLIPVVSGIKIHAMLTQMEIPPDSIERMKQRISHYAFEAALFCRERGDACEALEIFIGLKIPLLEHDSSLDDYINELLESTDIGGEGGSMRLVPASRSLIQALEIKKFEDIEEDPSSSSSIESCMICMDKYVRGVNVVRLPCSHLFHGECIIKWLECKNSCPLCRSVLPSLEA